MDIAKDNTVGLRGGASKPWERKIALSLSRGTVRRPVRQIFLSGFSGSTAEKWFDLVGFGWISGLALAASAKFGESGAPTRLGCPSFPFIMNFQRTHLTIAPVPGFPKGPIGSVGSIAENLPARRLWGRSDPRQAGLPRACHLSSRDYPPEMSASELLKQVKALPPRERQKFLLAVLTLEEAAPSRAKSRTRRVNWPDVEARARRIFGERVLPNLVSLEREEAAF